VFPYSETSLVVSWLARAHGRITTLVKGGYRPRSPFLGHVDLFYTCEILYYDRPGRDLHILRECTPWKYRPRFRGDWRACAAASYLSDLMYRIGPEQAHHGGLFEFLDGALDHLQRQGGSQAFLGWAELKLMALLGLAPRLTHCAGCRRSLPETGNPAVFRHDQGGVLCATCAGTHPGRTEEIRPDVMGVLAAWQRSRSARAAESSRLLPAQQTAMNRLLGAFLEYHLELPLASRTIALEILARPMATTS
jgi:DNA repair protein RecO (recombination protein O)